MNLWERARGLLRRPTKEKPRIKEQSSAVFSAEWKGQTYTFSPPKDDQAAGEEAFQAWFKETAPKMPSCGTCGQLIFPGDPVGSGDALEGKTGLLHMNTACCPSGGLYVGHISDEGELIPAFLEGRCLASHTIATGENMIVNISRL